ncbi:hypothetical protein ACSX1A_08335 [Pontibacter sp. MBLB2868]
MKSGLEERRFFSSISPNYQEKYWTNQLKSFGVVLNKWPEMPEQ